MLAEGVNGCLRMRILNPCECVNPDATIFVRVWVRGGPDLEFAVPRTAIMIYKGSDVLSYEPMQGIEYYQAGRAAPLGDTPAQLEPEPHVLVPSLPLRSSLDNFFPGQGVRSARAMIQKPTTYQLVTKDLEPTGRPRTDPATPITALSCIRAFDIKGPQMLSHEKYWGDYTPGNITGVRGFNYAAFYLRMFAAWTGSQYYTIATTTPQSVECSIATTAEDVTPWSVVAPVIPGAPVEFSGIQGGVSFLVPFCSPKKYYETCADGLDEYRARQTVVFRFGRANLPQYTNNGFTTDPDTSQCYVFYHSCGPDVSVYFYRQAPRIKLTGMSIGNWQYYGTANVTNPT